MNITTHLLLLALFSTPLLGELEDLCDIVNPDTGTPVRCEPHPEDAPVYAEPVCCDAAGCYKSDGGWCPDALQSYYCELGEVLASDEVACYFEVPDYCDVFPCAGPGYQAHPQAFSMCCINAICWPYVSGSGDCAPQDIYFCADGVCNEDGTVTCFD